jgi:hypothetical protein
MPARGLEAVAQVAGSGFETATALPTWHKWQVRGVAGAR